MVTVVAHHLHRRIVGTGDTYLDIFGYLHSIKDSYDVALDVDVLCIEHFLEGLQVVLGAFADSVRVAHLDAAVVEHHCVFSRRVLQIELCDGVTTACNSRSCGEVDGVARVTALDVDDKVEGLFPCVALIAYEVDNGGTHDAIGEYLHAVVLHLDFYCCQATAVELTDKHASCGVVFGKVNRGGG